MAKASKLSARQKQILNFMERYVAGRGYPPTIREIGEACNINSTSVVNYNLNKLVDMGYLERSAAKSRGVRMVKNQAGKRLDQPVRTSAEVSHIRLEGEIVAGQPVTAYTDSFEPIEVTPMLLNGADPSEVFALRVKGDSMIDAMIQDGDIVILRKTSTARNGQMVAVYLTDRDETTLKRFFKEEDGKVRLQPAHPTMQPIIVPADHCQIQGRVLSVLRTIR